MHSAEPIAIIGTGCRFPGKCDSPSKLWEMLREPKDLLKEIPKDRFSVDAFYHPENYHHGTSNVRHTYCLEEDLRMFDAQFFGIKPIEANSIDPQQRLLLETVYESVEAAGLSLHHLQGSDTAVYVGVMSADFTDMISRDIDAFPTYFATGTARSILSNRLSYFFDWRGPSMTIDTACSSSLIAMHQAVQTLRSRDSSLAVVAGSNLVLGPEQYIAESKLQMLSPTGRSRMWDAEADGYARGEGVAAIVLKRLSQALADGDNIECVIRETGTNQDGKTPGITMPSASAQASLIRSTYAKAGLDLSKRSDRPQYFEAHGTGTPAGDPIEAEAISTAFFGPGSNFNAGRAEDTLLVGGIKTVIGHTEGTAGLAAVIKASLALQSGIVPPNRLFTKLNPKIVPFYGNLKILSEAQKWPKLPEHNVRRASVNSFGFGGSNCHAILESFESQQRNPATASRGQTTCFTPFVFSAASESALIGSLESYRGMLEGDTPQMPLDFTPRDLSWTLSSRRSTLAYRAVLPATNTFADLAENITQKIERLNEDSVQPQSTRTRTGNKLRVLGIFTGQGAQWARMGAELIEKSASAREVIASLDKSLRSLPVQDRPSWLLQDQLLADAQSSQVNTASISQPLCTAIQILLVDLLKAAGISFATVVGHSSGEIGAAYAAGRLTSEDAIRIAYYRGLHLQSVSDKKGAMMAVGTSFDDATELCELPAFEGRVCVAASNSSASVTLSGDADAIDEVKVVLDEEKKFNRLLKVDKAYHSHHMQPMTAPYVRSLEECHIHTERRTACRWVSSVFVQDIEDVPQSESIAGKYWASNLESPVMFAEALNKTLVPVDGSSQPPYDLILEVGPHPALKGPATQTVQECLGDHAIPYIGTLSRGKNSVEAFSLTLGSIWEVFGQDTVQFRELDRFMIREERLPPRLVKGLPKYSWNHSREFWHESRMSKAFRTCKEGPNELLGRRIFDGASDQLRFKNFLKRREIEWLDGHQVQGQTVFPCAGYVSACIEAAMRLPSLKLEGQERYLRVQSIELQDFMLGQAVTFGDDQDAGVESLVTLTDITWLHDEKMDNSIATAKYSFYSSPNSDTLNMTSHASCRVRVVLSSSPTAVDNSRIPRRAQEDEMLEIEADRFYDALDKLGFGYSGPFRALTDLRRKLGAATGKIQSPASSSLLIHPATLDSAIQSIMLAYCYPGDSMLRSIYLPTGIKRLLVNTEQCSIFAGHAAAVSFDSKASVNTTRSLSGDVSIYSPDGWAAVQLEGLQTKPLSNATEASDLNIFTELVWDVAQPDGQEIVASTRVQELDPGLLFSLERVTYFYLRNLDKQFPMRERAKLQLEWYQERLFAYVDHCVGKVSKGANPFAKKEWIHDTEDDIQEIFGKYPTNIDLRLMRSVGQNLPAVIRGETSMLEHMIHDDMLNDFYVVAHGMPRYTKYLASMAAQFAHRYPHMNVLEIGAGTGGATKSFLKELGDSFSTYTFTDVSSGFFGQAEQRFSYLGSRMNFKVLDIEKDVEQQGFADGSFDLIIASLVLHATRKLDETLRNVRRLLKPGGYLLLLEITENEQMRFGLIFGGLPGWWLGYDDGRALSPCIGLQEWKSLLQQTGFSGIDTAIPHHETLPVPLSIIVSQAVDDRIIFLKQPLASPVPSSATMLPRLTIIGGGKEKTTKLAEKISHILAQTLLCSEITFVKSLEELRPEHLPVGGSSLCLADIDEPVFKSMNAEKLRGFQEVFKQSTNVLWVTQGSRFGDPFARMVIGFGRTIVLEMLHLRLQFLDISAVAEVPNPENIAASLLRLVQGGAWEAASEDGLGDDVPILYSIEPELYLEENGERLYVPRFKLNKDQNDRYNSGRRTVLHDVDRQKSRVELVLHDELYRLLEADPSAAVPTLLYTMDNVEVDVICSADRAVDVGNNCYMFPIVGQERSGERRRLLALSFEQASRVHVPTPFIMPAKVASCGDVDATCALESFYVELLAQAIIRDVANDCNIVLLQPDNKLAGAVHRLATDKGLRLVVLTATAHASAEIPTAPDIEWHYVHPMETKMNVQQLFYKIVTNCGLEDSKWHVVNLGGEATETIYQAILEYQALTPVLDARLQPSLTRPRSKLPANLDIVRQSIRALLVDAKYGIKFRGFETSTELPVASVRDVVDRRFSDREATIICWESTDSNDVTVQVMPIDNLVHFRKDRTYWLVGLTGGLGLSLCEWMSQHGARNLVISSRNPRVHEHWLVKMRSLGVRVEVIANDICDRDSVRSVHEKICREMPPIAGVAQGAMVLHDTMFTELNMDRVNKVMKPKVDGAMYLSEIFKNVDLEFFVFFSSMAAITGNPGQSAYAAANMFMSSLASQRRRRGLNASAVHIGAIFGNGYVTRELTLAQQEFLGKVGNLWLSEQDFRQLFAEAIFAGQHRRGKTPELSTGLKMIDGSQESEDTITWYRNPMFQHCIKSAGQDGEGPLARLASDVPIKAQLIDAVSPAEVQAIIAEAFAAKLRSSLQVEEDRDMIGLTADTLGIDSLVAVDIRSWFIKELQVEIPVLKILSGSTMGELLANAQELLPKTLTPSLDPNNKDNKKPRPKNDKSKLLKTAPKIAPNKKVSATIPDLQSTSNNKNNRDQQTTPAVTEKVVGDLEVTTAPQNPSSCETVSASSGLSLAEVDASSSSPNSSKASFEEFRSASNASKASRTRSSSGTWSEIDSHEVQSQTSSLETPITRFTSSASEIACSSPGPATTKKVPLAFAQSRFWFLDQYLQDASTAFNITVSIDLHGKIDVEKFRGAVKLVGQRHEALRTRFVSLDHHHDASSDVIQEVLAVSSLDLETRDVLDDNQADKVYTELQSHRYKLSNGEIMRIILLRKAPDSFRLLIGYHHINMDGVSLEVILRELQMAYDSKRLPARHAILQYPDFSEQQHRDFEAGLWAEDLAFWRSEFSNIPSIFEPIPLFPIAKVSRRSPLGTYSTHTADFHLDQGLMQNIQATCAKLKVTPFHFHLAVLYTLLLRLVDVQYLCIGVSSANRGYGTDMLQSVGMYLNLLPIVLEAQPRQTFTNMLKLIRDKSNAAFRHSKVPFDVIVNEMGAPRSTTHSPLFQVLVNYRSGVSERRRFCGCDSKVISFEQGQTAYDLSLDIVENPGGDCRVIVAGQAALYSAYQVDMIKKMYIHLIDSLSRSPGTRLSLASLHDPQELKSALQVGQGPFFKHQWPQTLSQRVEAMVQNYGDLPALIDAGRGPVTATMNYAQMSRRVDSIASAISKSHPAIGSRSVVGVFLDPSTDWTCALLAIWRLDATYVPFDPRNGSDRLSAIALDCKPSLLIVHDSTERESSSLGSFMTLNIDHVPHDVPVVVGTAQPDSVAAIMYTSGSTGVPKGIIMKHRTFRNNIEIMTQMCSFRAAKEVTLQQSSYSFDMSLCQTLLTLCSGGALHVVPKQMRGDPAAISSIISEQGITFTVATPAEYVSWIRHGYPANLRQSSWALAMTGGESVQHSLTGAFKDLAKPDLRLVDCYGPTEVTFCSSSRYVDYQASQQQHMQSSREDSSGLQTWPNYAVYIVDANLQPVPVGMPGEVLIGGAGVVAGYLHSELDARGFARDTFASSPFLEQGWTKLHRTGDFGRLSTSDGSLILHGRIAGDTQVKLRGLRIDLREIEAALVDVSDGSISDAAVTLRTSQSNGSDILVAFVCAKGDLDEEARKMILNALPLPQYMRPSAIVPIARLPTNASNKLDRAGLNHLEMNIGIMDGGFQGIELSDTECRMKTLWEEVISKEILSQYRLSPESDFFHVGGNSMLLVKLRAKIQQNFNAQHISLFQLFDSSTLKAMSEQILAPLSTDESQEPREQRNLVDWEQETALPDSLLRVSASRQFFSQPEVVVLTGATGFLGRAILSRLLDDGVVQKIHCLAVRQPKNLCEKRWPRLFQSSRVVVHSGDLSLPHFGMASEQQLLDIFSESHVVIHNGADVSFMKSYNSLRPANLNATKELVRLSLQRQLSFHYISTASVTHLTGLESFEQRSVGQYPPPSSPLEGYTATKWASERYLEKVSDRCELPIWIHRPSSITGEGAPDTDLMTNLLRFSRSTKSVPDTGPWRGWLNFVSVGQVAMQIADQVYEDYSWPGSVKYLYQSGEQEVPLCDIKGVLERETRSQIETVPLEQWIQQAEEHGLSPVLGEYLRSVQSVPLMFPRLIQEGDFF